jgi:hypothetical protein
MGWREWSDWSYARPLNDRIRTGRVATPINLTGDIPAYVAGSTHGRAVQFAESLSAVDRGRLVAALRDVLPRLGAERELDGLEYEQTDLREYEAGIIPTARPYATPVAAEAPIPDDETNFAAVRGRPSDQPAEEQPCPCDRCTCPNHAADDGDFCLSCQNGEHPGDPRY